jgi:hypothetical protein
MSDTFRKPLLRFLVVLFLLFLLLFLTVDAEDNKTSNGTVDSNESIIVECPPSHRPGKRFHVAKLDFSYVETPLLASVCVLFVSIAKVGE